MNERKKEIIRFVLDHPELLDWMEQIVQMLETLPAVPVAS